MCAAFFMTNLKQQAEAVLTANDRGGFTIPTAKLYPFQWNWDSAFAALGFATFDMPRAWLEIQTLLNGQWPDGMLPHIVFRQPDPEYIPGPDVWGTSHQPPSSGHSQPPVVTSVVLKLLELSGAEKNAKELYPKLFAYHRWYHNMRDPDNTGLIATIHPWETGRDNCPDWDSGMAAVEIPADLPAYQRRDTSEVSAEQRPSSTQYDQFLSIVKFGREHRWDHQYIYRHGPFLMADPGLQFILLRADRDLLALAAKFGSSDEVRCIQHWINNSLQGCEQLWNPTTNGYCARNLRTGAFSNAVTNASALCFYAGAGNDTHREHMLQHVRSILEHVKYAFPSWDPRDKQFESQRYWRGPVWAIMNSMIATGLNDCGHTDLATRIEYDTLKLIESAGFCEYFDPLTGEGLGGGQFTWTAAMYLYHSTNRSPQEPDS
jgi:alpha,alpha-trehalase